MSVAGRGTGVSLRRRVPPASAGCRVSGDQSTFQEPSRRARRSTDENSHRPSPVTSRAPVKGTSAVSPPPDGAPGAREIDVTCSSAPNLRCRSVKSGGGSATRPAMAVRSPARQASKYLAATGPGPSGGAGAGVGADAAGAGVGGSAEGAGVNTADGAGSGSEPGTGDSSMTRVRAGSGRDRSAAAPSSPSPPVSAPATSE